MAKRSERECITSILFLNYSLQYQFHLPCIFINLFFNQRQTNLKPDMQGSKGKKTAFYFIDTQLKTIMLDFYWKFTTLFNKWNEKKLSSELGVKCIFSVKSWIKILFAFNNRHRYAERSYSTVQVPNVSDQVRRVIVSCTYIHGC